MTEYERPLFDIHHAYPDIPVPSLTHFQIFAVALLLIASSCVSLRLSAYRDHLLDAMEAVALLCNVMMALIGGAFYLKMFSSTTLALLPTVALVLLGVVFSFLVLSVLIDASPRVRNLARISQQGSRVARLRAQRQHFSLLFLKGHTAGSDDLRLIRQRRRWLLVFAVSVFVVPPKKRRILRVARHVFEGFEAFVVAVKSGGRRNGEPYGTFRDWVLALTDGKDIDMVLSAMTTLQRASLRAQRCVEHRATSLVHDAFVYAANGGRGVGSEGAKERHDMTALPPGVCHVLADGQEVLKAQLASRDLPEFEPRSLFHDAPLLRRIDQALLDFGSDKNKPTLAYPPLGGNRGGLEEAKDSESAFRPLPSVERARAMHLYVQSEARRLKWLRDMRLAILEGVASAAQSRLAWLVRRDDEDYGEDGLLPFLQADPANVLEYLAFGVARARRAGASERLLRAHVATRRAILAVMRAGEAVWTKGGAGAGGTGEWDRTIIIDDTSSNPELAKAAMEVRQMLAATAWGWVARAIYGTQMRGERRRKKKASNRSNKIGLIAD